METKSKKKELKAPQLYSHGRPFFKELLKYSKPAHTHTHTPVHTYTYYMN